MYSLHVTHLVVFDFWSPSVLRFIFTVLGNNIYNSAFVVCIFEMPHAVRKISLRRTNRLRFSSINTKWLRSGIRGDVFEDVELSTRL